MLDAVLSRYKLHIRISVKSAVSVLLIALAVGLPQIAHVAGGTEAGAKYLPMYAPALLAGCLLGWQWGIGVGILSPVVSFGITSLALGSAMPAAGRLPVMIAELAVFGLVSGLFSGKIKKNALLAFPAVALAQVAGRGVYLIWNLIAGQTISAVWTSISAGILGLYFQIIFVPLLVIALAGLIRRGDIKRQ